MSQNTNTTLVFYLSDGLSPETWSLYQKDVLVKNPKTNFLEKIYYIPGTNSIWHSDLEKQGDVLKNYEKKSLYFIEGTLSVSSDDAVLVQYLKTHPDFNLRYKLVDKNADSQVIIDKTDLITKAVMCLQADTLDIKTVGLLVFGESALLQDNKTIEALVKQSAISNPQAIVDAYSDNEEWKYKKIVALALSKQIIRINATKTAVLWVDTDEPILTLAVGQKPIDELATFLAINQNETTLQSLSLKLGGKKAVKALEENLGTDETEGGTSQDSNTSNIEKLQKEYELKYGVIPPHPKKNNAEWLSKKLLEVVNS